MATLRVLLGFLTGGAVLGAVIASLVYPQYLVWNNTTASPGSNCNCADVTRQTTEWLIHGQLVGLGSGASVGLAIGVGFVWWRRKRAAAAKGAAVAPSAAPAAPPPPPAPPKS